MVKSSNDKEPGMLVVTTDNRRWHVFNTDQWMMQGNTYSCKQNSPYIVVSCLETRVIDQVQMPPVIFSVFPDMVGWKWGWDTVVSEKSAP